MCDVHVLEKCCYLPGVLIALIRPYIFGTTIFGVFSQTHAFSAIQIIIFRVYFLFHFILLSLTSSFSESFPSGHRNRLERVCWRNVVICLLFLFSDEMPYSMDFSFIDFCLCYCYFGDSPESLTQALTLPALFWRCMDQASTGLAHRHN